MTLPRTASTRSARLSQARRWGVRLRAYATEVVRYAREASSPLSFVLLMQVRLSLSKVGPVVCPHQVTRTVKVSSLGRVVIRSHTTDVSVLNELIVWHGYVQPAEMVDRPRTILDLGANTGLTARWFHRRWPEARIVSVEPEPGNVEVLRRNLTEVPAEILPVAVGGSCRRARLHTNNGEFAYTIVGEPTGEHVEVEVITMADVLRRSGLGDVDLLKVDVEGAEREIFADCGQWIGAVRTMIVECHAGYSAADLLRDCRTGGAMFRVVDLDRKPEWGFEVVTAARV